MKKLFFLAIAVLFTASLSAQSWEVVKKKGKCTMDEAYYNQIRAKADHYDSLQVQLDKAKKELSECRLKANQKPVIRTFEDSASYAIGQDLYKSWSQQNLGISYEIAGQGLIDCAKGTFTWDQKTVTQLLQRFQQSFEQREQMRQQQMMASLDDNIAAGKAFLKENANNKSVRTTESGLQYRIIQKGNGKKPTINDEVKVHYTGKLIDGKVFDSSVERGEPITFPLGAVIPGWTEGMQLLDEGCKAILYIPYTLGYGEQPVGDIPPGSTLIFEVELLEIIKH